MKLFSKTMLINCFLTFFLFTTSGLAKPMNGDNGKAKRVEAGVNWESFTSKDNGFSIDLPKTPEHMHQKVAIPQTKLAIEYDTYISEPSASIVYVISVWNYPDEIDMSKPEVSLKDGFTGMLQALPDSEVVDMKMSKINGFEVLNFKVKNVDIYFQGKLVLVHNTLYQVFAVYKEGAEVQKDFDRFAKSFQLIKPESRKIPIDTKK